MCKRCEYFFTNRLHYFPDVFGTWTAGAKIVFSGLGAQGFTNLSVTSVFANVEVNKSSGTLTTSSNFRFGSFTLTAGNFIVGSGNEIQGNSATSSITINGGTWTQTASTTKIYSILPTNPSPLNAININGGSMELLTSTGTTGFQLSAINVTNGGNFILDHFTTGLINIGSSISIDATSTFSTALTTTTLPALVTFNGTVNYNYAGPQTVSAATYNYLKLSGTGVKTLGGNTTIPANGTLEMSGVATSPTLTLSGYTFSVSNSGTNLLYTSTGTQTATTNEWNPNFQNITINNSSAVGVSMGGLTRTISGFLNLINGTFAIAGGALTLDGAALNRTNGYISGTNISDLTVQGTTGGTVTLPLSANISLRNVTVSGTRTLAMDGTHNISLNGALAIDATATYDNGGESQIADGGGGSISITGKFITRAVAGFAGANTAIPGITPTLNSGSTIEYGLLGNQVVQGSTQNLVYYNMTFSGSGTKTLTSTPYNNGNTIPNPSGTITVSGSAIFDAHNFTFGGAGTNLIMTGTATYKNTGTGTKPDAQGTYSLGPASTIEFVGAASTTPIRLGTPAIQYANIVVSGMDASTASLGTGIAFQAGGSFTVKNGATFGLQNSTGFSGSAGTAINSTNSPTITLETGSTVEYRGSNQIITNQIPYQNLSIAGSGNKTAPSGILTVQGNLTKSGTSIFLHNNGTVLLNGAAQNFAGLTYNNLILDGNTKTTAGSSAIIDSIRINDGTSLSISASDAITLHSDATKTGRVGQIGTGMINYNSTGKFIVERFIPAVKAWRFLAIPTSSAQTIKEAWQEGASMQSDDLIRRSGRRLRVTGLPGRQMASMQYLLHPL